jgi:hypothetical protein
LCAATATVFPLMGGRPHRNDFCSPEHLARLNPDKTVRREHAAFSPQPAHAFRNEKAAIADGFHHEEACASEPA